MKASARNCRRFKQFEHTRLAIIANIPTQSGRLLSHVFRSVQYKVRLPRNVSGNTNDGWHRNLTESSVCDTKWPYFGGVGTMHPITVCKKIEWKMFRSNQHQKTVLYNVMTKYVYVMKYDEVQRKLKQTNWPTLTTSEHSNSKVIRMWCMSPVQILYSLWSVHCAQVRLLFAAVKCVVWLNEAMDVGWKWIYQITCIIYQYSSFRISQCWCGL